MLEMKFYKLKMFLTLLFLESLANKKNYITEINQIQSLYIAINLNTLRTVILILWSFTLAFTVSLSNIFLCTYLSTTKTKKYMTELELEKQLALNPFS